MKNDFCSMGEGVLANLWVIKPAGKKVKRAKVHGRTSACISCIPHISLLEPCILFSDALVC